MIKAILFDLDGTLLPMDTQEFVGHYLQSFATTVAHKIDPELFVKALLKGTQAMKTNLEADKSNQEAFDETFVALTKVDKETFWPLLDNFYEETFPTLAVHCQPTPLARQIVVEALEQGYELAIATNPLFPKTAIVERLAWAGLAHLPFKLITAYEEAYFTKPHRQYYQWIHEYLGVKAEECLMVGNDMQEDMVTSQLGMKTFLVEDFLIDRGEPVYHVDARGTLEDLYQQLQAKEGIFSR